MLGFCLYWFYFLPVKDEMINSKKKKILIMFMCTIYCKEYVIKYTVHYALPQVKKENPNFFSQLSLLNLQRYLCYTLPAIQVLGGRQKEGNTN